MAQWAAAPDHAQDSALVTKPARTGLSSVWRQSGDSISIHWCSWYFACMSRLARMVVPGLPHHVTQRGNRREAIFFEDGDQQLYCDMLAEQLRKFNVDESFRDESFRRVSGEFSVRSFPDRYSR